MSYNLPTIASGGCIDNMWTATSTVNAPNGRENHKAVWTGVEMIIWGGELYTHVTFVLVADTIPVRIAAWLLAPPTHQRPARIAHRHRGPAWT